MTTTATYSLARPAPVATPRGALLVGWLADLVIRLSHQRQLARAVRARRRDALDVAALAQQLQDTEPGQAADLRAAVNRHFGD